MKNRAPLMLATILVSMALLAVVLSAFAGTVPGVAGELMAAPQQTGAAAARVEPPSAPNDLDTPITIAGSDFVSVPAVYLGATLLDDVRWVSAITLEATVPWGMDSGTYTLTVTNPGGEPADLPDAFTVTQGIDVWTAGALYGGKVNEIVINPLTPTTLYAVSESVGIFRSRDGGENWSFVYAGNSDGLAIDPITRTTIYWGTGGLLRSDDEGDTWNWLGGPVNIPYPHPTISGTLYATRRWGSSTEDGGGLWRSTDRGQTWVTATTGLTDTAVTGFVYHPTDPLTLYFGTAHGNIFSSTDGANSWSYVDHPINQILTLAINPRSPHELWVSNHCLDRPNLTLRSTNLDHTSWITVGETVGAESLESIDFAPISWGDAYSETVFVAGCWVDNLHRTTDGGDTWVKLTGVHSGKNDVALHPTATNTLYIGSRSDGALKSEDGGTTFRIVNRGITALFPEQMATVRGQPDVVYAITDRQEGIYKGTRGGQEWQFLDIGDWLDPVVLAVDPFTPTRLYVGDHSDSGWRLQISRDGGLTWHSQTITAPEPYSTCDNIGVGTLRPHPTHAGLLLAGVDHMWFGPLATVGGIYRSTDYGENWAYIESGEVLSHSMTDLAYDGLVPAIAYAATGWPGTGMLRSTDGGQSWEPIDAGDASLDHVWSIAAEPNAPYRVFAATKDNRLYVSANQGLSWTLAIDWLGTEEILSTNEEPPVLYAAGWNGLFRMAENQTSMRWERVAGVVGRIPIYSLATVTATDRVFLYAGTTGGYVETGSVQASSEANGGGTLVNAGVYRYTRRTLRIYLPLVVKAHSP